MGKKYNREQIALDLLLCSTNKEVCKLNNISEATLYRIKKEEGFKAILDEQRNNLFSDTMQKAQAYSLEAVEVLHNIATNEEAPEGTRVSACTRIIELAQGVFDQEQVINRIADLERRLENETK